jgi:RNA polymerase sigma-70 factor (ECF subfamily)
MALPPEQRRPATVSLQSASVTADRSDEVNEDARDIADLRSNFNALMQRYQKPIYNLVFRFLNDAEEASDITQETFISAYRARIDFRGDAKVSTWLYRIAVNHCKNRFKQRDRQREHEAHSLDENWTGAGDLDSSFTESQYLADWTNSPEVIAQSNELRSAIFRAVEALPIEYKMVLVLREMEGMNYNEIVQATGLTLETVKTRLSRARAMVRRRMEPYYYNR